ncbi:unnamed protein product, partial [Pylaiella littoralis]
GLQKFRPRELSIEDGPRELSSGDGPVLKLCAVRLGAVTASCQIFTGYEPGRDLGVIFGRLSESSRKTTWLGGDEPSVQECSHMCQGRLVGGEQR